MGDLLDLPDALQFSRGRHRACFVHPLDATKCIKVMLPNRALDQGVVEHDYHRYLQRRRTPLQHIAACHGWADTSRGPGLVFDRVYAGPGSGAESVNLEVAILSNLIDAPAADAALLDLERYLFTHRILWSDENPKNICVVLHPSVRFVIVDGLGGRRAVNLKYRLLKSMPLLARWQTSDKIHGTKERVAALLARAAAA